LPSRNGDGGGFFPEERLREPADILEICSGLVSCNAVVDDNDDDDNANADADGDLGDSDCRVGQKDQIQLAHFSVMEYLLSVRCAFRSDFAT
jgi:hypothetical protein